MKGIESIEKMTLWERKLIRLQDMLRLRRVLLISEELEERLIAEEREHGEGSKQEV